MGEPDYVVVILEEVHVHSHDIVIVNRLNIVRHLQANFLAIPLLMLGPHFVVDLRLDILKRKLIHFPIFTVCLFLQSAQEFTIVFPPVVLNLLFENVINLDNLLTFEWDHEVLADASVRFDATLYAFDFGPHRVV